MGIELQGGNTRSIADPVQNNGIQTNTGGTGTRYGISIATTQTNSVREVMNNAIGSQAEQLHTGAATRVHDRPSLQPTLRWHPSRACQPTFGVVVNVMPGVVSFPEIKVTPVEYFVNADPGDGFGTRMLAVE